METFIERAAEIKRLRAILAAYDVLIAHGIRNREDFVAFVRRGRIGLELAEMVMQQMGSEIALELYGPHLGGIVAKARELLAVKETAC